MYELCYFIIFLYIKRVDGILVKDEKHKVNKKEIIEKRANKMINLFSALKLKPLKDFAAPPFTKWLNGRILDVKRGEVTVEIDIRAEMSNPTGILHGGMQCAILDDVIGMTTVTLGYEGFLISIDMHVDFLGKVKIGETIKAHGIIKREGRHIVHADAELIDKNGKVIATGTSNLLVTHYKKEYSTVI